MAPAQSIEPKDLPPEVGVVVAVTHCTVTSSKTPEAEPMNITVATEPADAQSGIEVTKCQPSPTHGTVQTPTLDWEQMLDTQAHALLSTDRCDVWNELTRRFESRLILAALAATHGRRIEAAQKLGIGRNTITRKIQELGLECLLRYQE